MKTSSEILQFLFSSVFVLIYLFGLIQESVDGRPLLVSNARPRPDDAAAFARWLVSQSSWGVLNTISTEMDGAPFGNVVSFSDGLPEKGKGVPYFYLTTLDPTARNALKDQRSSFTISEYNLGSCGKKDPENPSCAKITLTGKLKPLENGSAEINFARTVLFTKHPEMKDWPKGHNFQVFMLDIENIFMINWFGGPKPLTVDQYLHAEMYKLVPDSTSDHGLSPVDHTRFSLRKALRQWSVNLLASVC